MNDFKNQYVVNKQPKQKLSAPKGTAKRIYNNMKRKLNNMSNKTKGRVAATILSAIVAFNVAGYVQDKYMQNNNRDFGELVSSGVNIDSLSLSQNSMDTLLKYDEFFESDSDRIPDKSELASMINELYDFNLKMAPHLGSSADNIKDIKVFYGNGMEKGSTMYSVGVYENNKTYAEDAYISDAKEDRKLPGRVCEEIHALEELDQLKSKLYDGRISEKNALKELEEIYNKMDKFATIVIGADENGRLKLTAIDKLEKGKDEKEVREANAREVEER